MDLVDFDIVMRDMTDDFLVWVVGRGERHDTAVGLLSEWYLTFGGKSPYLKDYIKPTLYQRIKRFFASN